MASRFARPPIVCDDFFHSAIPNSRECLPGFTNCKPKYRKSDGLFPFVRLHSHSGQQYPMAEAFEQEITTLYEAREQEREARRLQSSLFPEGDRGSRTYLLSDSEAQPGTRTGPPLLI